MTDSRAPASRRAASLSAVSNLTTLLGLAALLALSAVTDWLRPRYGRPPGSATAFVLGWLPNYLAGLAFVLVGLASLRFAMDLGARTRLQHRAHRLVACLAAGSLAGLAGWELAQLRGNLVFDVWDLVASAGGVLTGYVYYLSTRRFDRVPTGTR